MSKVAVVIRTKNEERWLSRCLKAVLAQDERDVEVVIVDNQSTDYTVDVAGKFPVKVLTIGEFTPGRALNLGIRATDSAYIVCLSAHCIPKDERWLSSLLRNMKNDRIAGVYGRQLPFRYSSDLNKRDLLITFGLDHRIQTKDSFFHNANSLLRRSVWHAIPFDEALANIEDRAWGQAVIEAGFQIAYEPDAAVYHHHGIHQDQDQSRARNVVRIMEALHGLDHPPTPVGFSADTMTTAAIVPLLGPPAVVGGRNLFERLLQQIRAARFISRLVVVAEHADAIAVARRHGAQIVERPPELGPQSTVEQVVQYGLREAERDAEHIDAVVFANSIYPFRPPDFFDELIVRFAHAGVDSVVTSLNDHGVCWKETDGQFVRVDAGFQPKGFRHPLHRGFIGLGCITSSEFVRQGSLLGNSIDLIPLDLAFYSVRAEDSLGVAIVRLAFEHGTGLFGAPEIDAPAPRLHAEEVP